MENTGAVVYKHIGIYAYKRDFVELCQDGTYPAGADRISGTARGLGNGYKIKVIATDFHFVGVDTPEDLVEVNRLYQERL